MFDIFYQVHIDVQHEGKRFPCDVCDHAATSKTYLKYHQESL